MQYLRQSTAFTFRIGPFLDEDDRKTAETALTIAQADIQISKAGGAFAQTSASPTTTHDTDGWYQCPLTAADTGTLGLLDVQIHVAGALPIWRHFNVIPANVFDSMFSTDLLQVDVAEVLADIFTLQATCNSIVQDTAELQTDDVPGLIAALNDLDAAAVNAEVDSALDTAIPGSPTSGSINERIKALDDKATAVVSGAFTGTPTTTTGNTDLTGFAVDVFIDRYIYITSGTYQGEFARITGYVVASGVLTYEALSGAPANTDTFVIA